MISSMTGYGKAAAALSGGVLTVEIRSVNSKGVDISIKSSLLPKEHEMEVRKRLAERLQRGTIDLFLSWEPNSYDEVRGINLELAGEYLRQLSSLLPGGAADGASAAYLAGAVLRLPDIVDSRKQDIVNEENWLEVSAAIDRALDAICDYRSREGESLYKDITFRVSTILSLYDEVEKREPERIEAIRARILRAAEELQLKLDAERLEQEMIFYLEKLDINEEKVRLRQHCRYFMDTIDSEACPGKKLGFIIQEMGREINTTGSKASDAHIQKLVVRMKDELEKIREQSMNVL